ncbi:MAG: Wzz/FepE/Etk N-terminal domain-containing protein [Eubacteriales bacterium]|nr:Wzz/FepE/Etk N-terminal domain-containing protein [Eubacteriales bacterium]
MSKPNDDYEIDLMQILYILWHRLWIILLAAVVAGGAAFSVATFVITPLYEAEALMFLHFLEGYNMVTLRILMYDIFIKVISFTFRVYISTQVSLWSFIFAKINNPAQSITQKTRKITSLRRVSLVACFFA